MNVKSAAVVETDGEPVLELDIEGHVEKAVVGKDAAKWIDEREMDVVYLGPAFEGKIPALDIVRPDGLPMTLPGFTDDQTIVDLTKRFLSGDLSTGTVAVH